MTEREQDKDFLRRWSRRKIDGGATDEGPPAVDPSGEIAAVAPGGAGGPDDSEDEVADVVSDLPDIDTLGKDSDYTLFMRDGVPEELKRLALRKLWLSDPVLANLDGLNDYDEDFGAIMKAGAKFMQGLADAGEKYTRPGAEPEEGDEVEEGADPETVAADDGTGTDAVKGDEAVADSASDPRLDDAGLDVADASPPDAEDPSAV